MEPTVHRLFFALWPQPSQAQMISALTASLRLDGRVVAAEKRHITLYFLGQIGSKQKDCALNAGSKVQGHAFLLILDALQYIKRSGMVWLTANKIPAELDALLRDLGRELRMCGIELEQGKRFIPHMTLVRKNRAKPVMQKLQLAPWEVDRFCLIESVPKNGGYEYVKLGEWRLSAA